MPDETMTYKTAMSELSQIVNHLQKPDDVDVDDLVTKVTRAKRLIAFCEAKVTQADAQIKTLVADLSADDSKSSVMNEEQLERDGAPDEQIPF
ncbi:MAG: exodeoxyribonuclease VII small subunit [Gemmataceae bacterium]